MSAALLLVATACGGSNSGYPTPRYADGNRESGQARSQGADSSQAASGRNIPPSYYPKEEKARRAEPPRRPARAAPRYLPPDPLRAWTVDELDRIYDVQLIVREASRANRIPVDLINGIIWVESKFKTRAVSRKGPLGLMQIMPRTGRWLARELDCAYLPYDHKFNIHAGTFYFARMLKRFKGNVALALAAYNAGPGTVDKWLRKERDLPDETRAYVNKVLSAADAFNIRGI